MPERSKFSDGKPATGYPSSGQMALPLQSLPEPRDYHLAVKEAAAADLKECRWSRDEVADRLSLLIGRRVSRTVIDAVVAETKDHRFPAEWLPAWVVVTGSRRLLDLLCTAAGFWLADQTEHDFAEFARLQLSQRKSASRAKALQERLMEQI